MGATAVATRPRSLPETLSSSSMETFEQCPKRYEFSRVDHLPDPGGVEAVRGSFVHLVLEQLFSTTERVEDRARELCAQVWESFRESDDYVRLGLGPDAERAFKAVAWQGVVGCLAMEDAEFTDVVATEQRLEESIGGARVVGIIDRVDRIGGGDSLEIVDYKTGKVPKKAYRSKKLAQGQLYAALYEAAGKPRPERVRFLFVTHQVTLAEPVSDISVGAVVERVASVRAEIDDAYEKDKFLPRIGPLCHWCAYQGICPAFGGGGVVRA